MIAELGELTPIQLIDAQRDELDLEREALARQRIMLEAQLADAEDEQNSVLFADALFETEKQIRILSTRIDGLEKKRRVAERRVLIEQRDQANAELKALLAEGAALTAERDDAEQQFLELARRCRRHFDLVRDVDLRVKRLSRDVDALDPVHDLRDN